MSAITLATGYKDLTLTRFLTFNVGAFAALSGALFMGWPQEIVAADSSRITWAIAGLFAAGWLLCLWRVFEIGAELDAACNHGGEWLGHYHDVRARRGEATARSVVDLRLRNRIAPVRQIAGVLVILGLIGTVIGFITAFAGVSTEAATDTAAAGRMITEAMGGMSVALYTTLCGAVGNIWLISCYRILQGGVNHLAVRVFES